MSHSVCASELNVYFVETPNERIGYVDQVFFNEQTWEIPAFRLSTQHEFFKRHLTIPHSMVDRIDLSSRRIFLNQDIHQSKDRLEHPPTLDFVHSIHDLTKFEIHTPERSFGKVEDLLFDRETWKIEHLVIKTHKFIGGKHILISPEQVQKLSWEESQLFVSLHESEVLNSPEFTYADPAFQKAHFFG